MSPSDQAQSLPADAVLTELLIVLDPQGIKPPIVLNRDFACEAPKSHDYYLRGSTFDLSAKGIERIVNSRGRVAKLLPTYDISPIRATSEPDTSITRAQVGRDKIEGVDVIHCIQLAEAKQQMFQKVVSLLRRNQLTTIAGQFRRLADIDALGDGFGCTVDGLDDQQAHAAYASLVEQVNAFPEDDQTARAVRDFVAESLQNGPGVLHQIDTMVAALMSVRAKAYGAAVGAPVQHDRVIAPPASNEFDFDDDSSGIPFRVRIVLPGEPMGHFALLTAAPKTSVDDKPMVEFFDRRYPHTPRGQFTGGRYYFDVFMRFSGLCLQGGEPAWDISRASMDAVKAWAVPRLRELEAERAGIPNADLRGYAWAIVSGDRVLRSGSVPAPEFAPESEDTRMAYYAQMAQDAGGDLYIGGYPQGDWAPQEGLIFGMTWEELQARQQGRLVAARTVEGKMPRDPVLVYSARFPERAVATSEGPAL